MGYTHYFKGKASTNAKFKEFSDTCKKLHDNLPEKTDTAGGYHNEEPLTIKGDDGDSEPIFGDSIVCFNGDITNNMMHETFCIEKQGTSDFCKTERKPYDLLVVACLIAAWQILNYRFGSDGFNPDGSCDDLQPAIDLYNKVIEPKNKITGLPEPINQEMLWKQRMS